MTDTRIPIPPEVWDAFHEAVQKYGYGPHAIAACLAAWPGAKQERWKQGYSTARTAPVVTIEVNRLILPLPTTTHPYIPTEARDD